MSMSYRQQLRQTIEHIENEIENSRYKNEELEKYLTRLKVEEMEEDIKESDNLEKLKVSTH